MNVARLCYYHLRKSGQVSLTQPYLTPNLPQVLQKKIWDLSFLSQLEHLGATSFSCEDRIRNVTSSSFAGSELSSRMRVRLLQIDIRLGFHIRT